MMKTLGTIVAAVLTAAAWTCAPVLAQGYPNRPITLVVPYPPGGSTDLLARSVAQRMGESMGQRIIVENRSGAGGVVGSGFAARAAPDGYTILLGNSATQGLMKFTMKAMTYDPVNDFTALTEAVVAPLVLAVHSSVPASNVKEFVEYVKKNPGKISFGSVGTGSPHHLAGILFNQIAGIDMVHVPYKGSGQSVQDLVGGQIPAVFMTLSTAIPQARSGNIRILGLIEAERQPSAPDIPTIGESLPGYVMSYSWHGFFGPAGLPAPIVTRLNTELVNALHGPDIRAKLEAAGLPVRGTSAEEFAAVVRKDFETYRKLTSAANVKPE